MLTRRTFAAGAGSTLLAGLAGCLDILLGEEDLEFVARPARVAADTLEKTGYRLQAIEDLVAEREFSAAGETRHVVVTNVQTSYEKRIDLGPLGDQEGAVFTVLTTPQVRVLGREFNPVGEMSPQELAEMVQDQYDEIRNIEFEEERPITIHGESTTESKFRAESTVPGAIIELSLHISAAVEMGEDLLVTVGGYPRLTPEEEDNILSMMESVEPDT